MSLATDTVVALRRWRRQRLSWPTFVGVASIVALAADALAVAFVWVAALRLWDDVNSIDDDAVAHPDRVTVVGPRAHYVAAAIVAVVVACAAAVVAGHSHFFFVVVGLLALYGAPSSSVITRYGVLLKYPAMAWALADGDAHPHRLLLLLSAFVIDERVLGDAPIARRVPVFVITAIFIAAIAVMVVDRIGSLHV